MLRNASVCAFVIPVSTPSSPASRLTAKTFVNGGAPARIATGLPRSSGSRRTTAWAGKSGTNRDAKANVCPLSLVEERETTGVICCLWCVRLPASEIGGLRQHSRTGHFSLNFKSFERRSSCFNGFCGAAPFVCFPLAPENKRSAAFRTGLFAQQKQYRRRVFDRTTKTKPHAQIDSPRIHPRDSPEIENHDAPSTAVQEQVSGPQRLFEPLPRFCTSTFLPHRVCWIALAK